MKKLIFHLKIHKFNSSINIIKILFINIFYTLPFIRNHKNKINISKINNNRDLSILCKNNIFDLYRKGCTAEGILTHQLTDKIIDEIFVKVFARKLKKYNAFINDAKLVPKRYSLHMISKIKF